MECTSIKMFKEDGLPVNICNNCLEKLNSAYNFKEMVLQSNIELHELIQKIMDEKRDVLIKKEHIGVENNLFNVSSEICTSNQSFASNNFSHSNSSEAGSKIVEEKKEVLIKEEHEIVESNLGEVSSEICASYQPFASVDCSNLNFSKTSCKEVGLKQDVMQDVMSYNYETRMAFENENTVDLESPNNTKCISLITTPDFPTNYGSTENEKGESHSSVYSDECNETLTVGDGVGSSFGTSPGNLPFKCKECDREFAKKAHLRKHISRHSLVARFPCDECGKMFKYRHHIELHKATHKTERPYKCDICNMSFKLLKVLRRHEKTHAEREAKYVCEICDRAFIDILYLNRHKIIHVSPDSKDFICKTCGKSFSLKRSLKKHMKNHSDDKPHVCPQCGQSFRYKWVLKKHVLIHTDEKPFSCNMCEKAFRRKGTLSNHMRKTHGEESQEQMMQEKKDV
ncbi:hypothetical protein Trydic_g23448 [Trypoxylus dichotomus]